MDVALSMSSIEDASSPYDSLNPAPDAAASSLQAHRNLQSMSDLSSSIHSPRRFRTPSSRTSPAPALFHQTDTAAMDVTPAYNNAETLSRHESLTAWPDTERPASISVADGQDHDRMDTDDESSAEDDISEPDQDLQDQAPSDNLPPHSGLEEPMDTTPDEPQGGPHQADPPPPNSPDHPQSPPHANQTSSEPDAMNPLNPYSGEWRITDVTIVDPNANNTEEGGDVSGRDPSTTNQGNVDGQPTTGSEGVNDEPQQGHTQVPDPGGPPPHDAPATEIAHAEGWGSPQQASNESGSTEPRNGGDEESSEEEEPEEEDRAYWADYVDDTTVPDEGEIRMIEEDGQELNATNHDHWESLTYEVLEDPEYIAGETGRITWTANPIHGTPDKPNRGRIMRSPSVLIGGMYWNIKFFPRGNDGTDHMSVYIECSPSPLEESDSENTTGSGESSNEAAEPQPSNEATAHNDGGQTEPATTTTGDLSANIRSSEDDNASTAESEVEDWEVPAQVSCVVYNPNEPRVHTFRKTSHRFTHDNADWGWTRFHGPWENMHLRQRLERQALLRNDTLAFTAYIRTVKDDTKNLWWHAPKKGPEWDSYERIGVKSLATGSSSDNAAVAAIACWLHLNPIVKFINEMDIPGPFAEPSRRKRPFFAALQQLLEYMFSMPEDTDRHFITNLLAWLDWYLPDTPGRTDNQEVVSLWDAFRRIINYEASGSGDMATALDLFKDVTMLKQPDPWKNTSPILSAGESNVPEPREPRSVQEALDFVSASDNPFLTWTNVAAQPSASGDLPKILQIELHRQNYNRKTRHWDKLTHQISINESITYARSRGGSKGEYTLYGMVVHDGALTSEDFYAVIRPQGPGTRWLKYSGTDHDGGVTCLTTNQAIAAHEGKGDSSTGDLAVAYVVLYVRTDSLSDTLSIFPLVRSSPSEQSATGGLDKENVESGTDSDAWLRIFKSSLFDTHEGRGLPDLWAPEASKYVDLQLPKATQYSEISKHLDRLPDEDWDDATTEARAHDHVMMYHMDTGLQTSRGLPRLTTAFPNDTLGEIARTHDGCRLWLHRQPETKDSQGEDVTTTEEPATIGAHLHGTHDVDSAGGDPEVTQGQPTEETTLPQAQETPTETAVEPPTTTNEPPANVEGDVPNTVSERNGPTEQAEVDIPPTAPDGEGLTTQDDENAPTRPQSVADDSPESRDTTMEDAADPEVAEDDETRDRDHMQSASVSHAQFFLKLFDGQAQTLRAVGTKCIPPDNEIHSEVVEMLGSEGPWDVYHENTRSIKETDIIRSGRRFSDYGTRSGLIFIAQRRPSLEESASLIAEGKHPTPISYFHYLRFNEEPAYLGNYNYDHQFGNAVYVSGSYKYGFAHGQGMQIDSTGDVYTGNWTHDDRSGQGTMAYADGNTYEGNFKEDLRDGQGKMVYGKTGNVYEGGWKQGRRHGKGVMKYEVSDEEVATCKICYEGEMDAVFFDCGHIVACLECARLVESCPICRKSVRGVCRVFRT
ncbi:MAG: hypothetical protein Q9174_003509 [Haloplaca sp. 1 TL-2023]